MKAVKITNIEWDLSNVPEEKKAEVLRTLPKVKGFFAKDNFNVLRDTDRYFMNKYGYSAETFNYSEFKVAENISELLLINRDIEDKPKLLFTSTGKLSVYGKKCYNQMIENLAAIKKLTSKNYPETEYSDIQNQNIVAVEKLTGMSWKSTPLQTIYGIIDTLVTEVEVKAMKEAEK